jgi:hypothetical protein
MWESSKQLGYEHYLEERKRGKEGRVRREKAGRREGKKVRHKKKGGFLGRTASRTLDSMWTFLPRTQEFEKPQR